MGGTSSKTKSRAGRDAGLKGTGSSSNKVDTTPKHEGSHSSVVVPRLGVSLPFLKHALRGLEDKDIRTICPEFVLKATAKRKISFAEHLLLDAATSSHVKPVADVFVSYADIVSALETKGFASAFCWLDI